MIWICIVTGVVAGVLIRRQTENKKRLRTAFHLGVWLSPILIGCAILCGAELGASDTALSLGIRLLEGSIGLAFGYFTLAEIGYRYTGDSIAVEMADLELDLKQLEDEVSELESDIAQCQSEVQFHRWEIEKQETIIRRKREKIANRTSRIAALNDLRWKLSR